MTVSELVAQSRELVPHRAVLDSAEHVLVIARGEPFGRGKWAAYSAATHHDWLRADEVRRRLKRTMSDFFSRWHAIITPVAPTTAFEHIDTGDAVSRMMDVDGKPSPYHLMHGWIALATICHLPAVVIPVPRKPGQLPCGIQIIGPEGGVYDESTQTEEKARYEEILDAGLRRRNAMHAVQEARQPGPQGRHHDQLRRAANADPQHGARACQDPGHVLHGLGQRLALGVKRRAR